jgi:hypothetical protein
MIDSRELISAMRQLGSLTEAGVDILRAIRVLRAQTQNAELVALYDRLAQELRLGSGLADAMSHAPQAFSAFAVSIVRQGEARGDLATSFYRIADYLQKEQEVNSPNAEVAPAAIIHMTNPAQDQCPPWLENIIRNALLSLIGLFGVLLAVEILVALGVIPLQWHFVSVALAVLLFLLGVAWRLHSRQLPAGQLSSVKNQPQSADKSTFAKADKSTSDKSSEATFE